jgi:hypothetical protein
MAANADRPRRARRIASGLFRFTLCVALYGCAVPERLTAVPTGAVAQPPRRPADPQHPSPYFFGGPYVVQALQLTVGCSTVASLNSVKGLSGPVPGANNKRLPAGCFLIQPGTLAYSDLAWQKKDLIARSRWAFKSKSGRLFYSVRWAWRGGSPIRQYKFVP